MFKDEIGAPNSSPVESDKHLTRVMTDLVGEGMKTTMTDCPRSDELMGISDTVKKSVHLFTTNKEKKNQCIKGPVCNISGIS